MAIFVTSLCCIETAERIKLAFGLEALLAWPIVLELEREFGLTPKLNLGTFFWNFVKNLGLRKISQLT